MSRERRRGSERWQGQDVVPEILWQDSAIMDLKLFRTPLLEIKTVKEAGTDFIIHL